MKPIRLVQGFLTVGIWTLLSRVFGFARDIMIAGYLGAGPVAEAFLVAFSLPNMFRRFFAEGAFNMAFVPMFSKKVEAGDDVGPGTHVRRGRECDARRTGEFCPQPVEFQIDLTEVMTPG